MKVLLINDYATATAGAERITLLLRDGLRERGHTVRVFASDAQLIAGTPFADVTCFGTNSRVQTLSSMWNPSAARTLQQELRTFRPDVVQVQMFLWQLSPSILSLLATVPSVYYVMTYKPVCPTGLKWLPSGQACRSAAGLPCLRHGCLNLTGFVPLMLQRQLWRSRRDAFSAVVTCSHAVRRYLEDDGVRVHDVVWPGVPEVGERTLQGALPTVTFTGRLDVTKGVDVLLRAFALVLARVPQARLLIAGVGSDAVRLRALASGLGVAASTQFMGHLDDPALASLYGASWVHAVPSLWPEPFGLTATEAMMRGVPVVGSDLGGIAESVVSGETGFRVPPGDVPALADALLRVLADAEMARMLGQGAHRRAREHFGASRCVSRFESLYATLQ